MSRYVYLDFEFNGVKEETMNVICVSYCAIIDGVERIETLWLLDPDSKKRFLGLLETWRADSIPLVAFYAIAEARAILSLGIDPRMFKWVDLWIEYRMLLNHNHKYECGKQLIDGKVKYIKPPKPKWEREEGYTTGGKAETSLAACTYKLLGISRDTEHKKDMRDLIIHGSEFTEIEAMDIMEYCEEDILHLPKIHAEIFKAIYKTYDPSDRKHLREEMYTRGEYAIATALMEKKGYPIDYIAAKSFADSVPDIVYEMQKAVNEEFPKVGAFLESVKGGKFIQKKKNIQNWVKAQGIKDWMLTEKGDLSLKLEAFEEHYSHKNDPTIFGNRFVKYLRDKQSLNGFSANTSKTTLWDYIGKDTRIRPYFGIFVAQSSRSQPSATGYIMLKSRWMRVLVQPPRGKCIVAIDYGQQEFLLAALLSEREIPDKDRRMISAYHSGDPYLYTAKIAKAVPQDATKHSHGFMRDKFKSTCLAAGSLIRVKDWGYLPIEEITEKHLVWDGRSWRKTKGAKYMGVKEVITVEGISVTPDHLILTDKGEWEQCGSLETAQREGGVYFKNAARLPKPRTNWEELWKIISALKLPPNTISGKSYKPVYDLIDVEETSRFMAINGVVYHNCLGIQYGMAEQGLQKKLTNDTRVPHTVEEALELINLFEEAYPSYIEWKRDTFEEYVSKGYIRLPDGWTMFGDNHNKRSVTNMPVQGLGAAIMRKAVILAQARGLDVIMTLHDAIYVECSTELAASSIDILADCMNEAFRFYFLNTPVEKYAVCRLDPTAWGCGFSGETLSTSVGKVTATSKYIDKGRFEDYKRYRQYFAPQEDLELLTKM